MQAAIEPKLFAQISLALAVLIGALRYIAQPSLRTDEEPTDKP